VIPYQLQLNLDGADSQLMVSSSIKGVAVDLPAPFGMAADVGRDTVFRMTLQGQERRIGSITATGQFHLRRAAHKFCRRSR
jgi:uncharacterized protein YhdP